MHRSQVAVEFVVLLWRQIVKGPLLALVVRFQLSVFLGPLDANRMGFIDNGSLRGRLLLRSISKFLFRGVTDQQATL